MNTAEQQQRFADWTGDHSAILYHVVNGFAAGDVRNDLLQEVSSNELASMAVFFGGTLLLSGAGIAARYFGRVLPQHRQLNALLGELTDQTQ